MASSSSSLWVLFLGIILAFETTASWPLLSPTFYQRACPQALPTIKRHVIAAVQKERRMGASLLRLHFHDCFVNGCDASILLDDTGSFVGEKTAVPNNNSARGYEVIDQIKSAVDAVCGGPVVSCADILTVAARDSVVALGGPTWTVPLGRRDSTTASFTGANNNLPSPFLDLPGLISNFQNQGLGVRDMVALSGGHTLGFAKCATFRRRIYNDANIDPSFARSLQASCPLSGGDNNLAPLDPTPAHFDVNYFRDLPVKRGLLHSDQALFTGGSTDGLVRSYIQNPSVFSADFARAMVNMGNIKPLTGTNGQIRRNCRKVN